jgi:erythromycin esterase
MLSTIRAQFAQPLVLDARDDAQYSFLSPLLRNVEVVSLSESIHMTHEFPIARLGIVRWLNRNSQYSVVAFEGAPEDMWVSQDGFLRNERDLNGSTSGLFGIWNTDEMRSIFAYERGTWQTDHPLYMTAYDIQPGTGKGSSGPRVFELLREHLTRYAAPPPDFDAAVWTAALKPLTASCKSYKPADQGAAEQAIHNLEQWITLAAPKVKAAYPNLPMHAEALGLIPQSLRMSLALCQTVGGSADGRRNWHLYKETRDRLGAQYAMSLKTVATHQRLILWAHLSHLSYDAAGTNTSVGELLHRTLGRKLYSIGTFATGGGTIVLFSDVNEDFGYARLTGISKNVRAFIDHSCQDVCFTDLRDPPAGSLLAGSQNLWIESRVETIPLADDVDGAIWVTNVHPPHLPLPLLLILSGRHYVRFALSILVILLGTSVWLAYRRRRRVHPVDQS